MKIRNMAQIGLCAALICLCGFISVPAGVFVFTLQSFGVFFALFLLGGRRGCWAILTYLALGAVGLPVFSGFQGGLGALLGATGGYLWGFLLAGVVCWPLAKKSLVLAAVTGMAVCYAAGTLWYGYQYLGGNLLAAAAQCVLPYVLPDGIKITLAYLVAKKLKRLVY